MTDKPDTDAILGGFNLDTEALGLSKPEGRVRDPLKPPLIDPEQAVSWAMETAATRVADAIGFTVARKMGAAGCQLKLRMYERERSRVMYIDGEGQRLHVVIHVNMTEPMSVTYKMYRDGDKEPHRSDEFALDADDTPDEIANLIVDRLLR